MMISEGIFFLILSLTGFFLGILSILVSVLNRGRFKEVCVLYEKEFGSLPTAVKLFKETNTLFVSFAYSTKMQFIYVPLFLNRSSVLSKNNDKYFIRGLPSKLIAPIKIEFYLALISLMLLIIAVIFMKLHKLS